jgi:hypothetical protein
MAFNKVIGLSLIGASILLMLHSLATVFINQYLKASVTFPDFITPGVVDFFQFETAALGKAIRILLILILPSLGMELYKNKKNRYLTIQLLLRVAAVIVFTTIVCYILFYPFFE